MSLPYTKPARLPHSRPEQWRVPVPPDRGTADRDMKIAMIEVIVVGIPFAGGSELAESAWGKKNASRADSLLVKVTTEGGIIGWGEAFGFLSIPAVKAAIEEVIAPLCIGVSAVNIGSLMLDVQKRLHIFGRSGVIMFGISAINIALWDILGKVFGQPVHRLLGGTAVSELTCYASLVRYSDPQLLVENVNRALADGFSHLKLHESPWMQSVRREMPPATTWRSRWTSTAHGPCARPSI